MVICEAVFGIEIDVNWHKQERTYHFRGDKRTRKDLPFQKHSMKSSGSEKFLNRTAEKSMFQCQISEVFEVYGVMVSTWHPKLVRRVIKHILEDKPICFSPSCGLTAIISEIDVFMKFRKYFSIKIREKQPNRKMSEGKRTGKGKQRR